MKEVTLKKDRQERYNSKRGWYVNAWRLVTADGKDAVQPWFNTMGEARTFAKTNNWKIVRVEK